MLPSASIAFQAQNYNMVLLRRKLLRCTVDIDSSLHPSMIDQFSYRPR
jgi:hypothetical protein